MKQRDPVMLLTKSGKLIRSDSLQDKPFRVFADLRVQNGWDTYSGMKLAELSKELGSAKEEVRKAVFKIWRVQNHRGKNYPLTPKQYERVLRWHLRGLEINAAIRKVRVDYEIQLNDPSSDKTLDGPCLLETPKKQTKKKKPKQPNRKSTKVLVNDPTWEALACQKLGIDPAKPMRTPINA